MSNHALADFEGSPNGTDASTETDRPDDCCCEDFHTDVDLPCWPCYRDGFEEPAATEGAA